MKKISILTLGIGIIAGAAIISLIFWIWQILTHNISIITVAVVMAVAAVVFLCCQIQVRKSVAKSKKENIDKLKKYQSYYKFFSSWMILKNQGKKLSEYFEDHNYQNVAIYGLGKLGMCLYEELKSSNVNVKYAIDINAAHFSYLDFKVVSPESPLETVDVIVVTPFLEYEKIVDNLRKQISCKIVSLADIISGM